MMDASDDDTMTEKRDPQAMFERRLPLVNDVYVASDPGVSDDEAHTSAAFSEKWTSFEQESGESDKGWELAQLRWYLTCYGYADEAEFASFLGTKSVILDAGCGPGYKAAWIARLNPDALVVAMDLSDSIYVAARRYGALPNIIFVKGDIANTPFCSGLFDFISCDQVLHHTDNPAATVREFYRLLGESGSLNTYVYARKAVPRELIDEHILQQSKQLAKEEIWELADQVTRLGKILSELNIEIDVPDIPALGIKGGPQDLQRFLHWNFLKCFWNPEYGFDASRMTNFDWYAPSTAFRYSSSEFQEMVTAAGFTPDFLYSEDACHSGRFLK
jgi:SAM-dependent methyltransferase